MDEELTFTEDLAHVSISFFIAKRPHHRLSLEWFRFFIDGEEISVVQSGELPSNQGPWMLLGMFEEGRKLKLGWAFRTGIDVPTDGEVVLGHFPNGRLTRATRFQRLTLKEFTTYEGETEVLVKRS